MPTGARRRTPMGGGAASQRNCSLLASARQLQALVRRHSGLSAALLPWCLGFQWRCGYVRENCTCASNNMTLAPGRYRGCSERPQFTLKIASGFAAVLRCEFDYIVFLGIIIPQVASFPS